MWGSCGGIWEDLGGGVGGGGGGGGGGIPMHKGVWGFALGSY